MTGVSIEIHVITGRASIAEKMRRSGLVLTQLGTFVASTVVLWRLAKAEGQNYWGHNGAERSGSERMSTLTNHRERWCSIINVTRMTATVPSPYG